MARSRTPLVAAAAIGAGAAWLRWFHHVPTLDVDLTGKRVLLTGGNSGIGLATATNLAAAGAEVLLTSRSRARADEACAAIRTTVPGARVSGVALDLASLDSVASAAKEVAERVDGVLDVLVNNAGHIQGERKDTDDGNEMTFAVNHLGPFALTLRLLPLLRRAAPSRIVNVASVAHRKGEIDFGDLDTRTRPYVPLKVYADTKLANVLFTRELARRLDGHGITVNCCHPGTIASSFGKDEDATLLFKYGLPIAQPFMRKPPHGAIAPTHLAGSPDVAGVTGAYFVQRNQRKVAPQATDDQTAAELFRVSEKRTGLTLRAALAA